MKTNNEVKLKKSYEGKFNGAGDVVALLVASNPQLDRYIGMRCEFKAFEGISYAEAEKRAMAGWGMAGRFEIIGVQNVWGGQLAFRVKSLEFNDKFGRPAKINEINIIN